MKKSHVSLLIFTLLLSGCTMKTAEVRPETDAEPKLNFYPPEEKQNPAAANNEQTPPPPPPSTPTLMNGKTYSQPPEMTIRADKKYTATLKTDLGDITVELAADQTPITVNNFVFLARDKFYDNTIFHRVMKGFMIQGGDPKGDGTGGPGYRFNDESFEGEYTRGTVAMANAGPNTNGSQFFIMHQTTALSPDYVIFGTVTEGMEIVDRIAEAPVQVSPGGENSQPVTPVRVNTVTIEEKE